MVFSSRGASGASIAKALADRGVEVTLLGSKELLRTPERLDPRLRLAPFDAFADLSTALSRLAPGMDLVFMAPAVADYSPVREGAGKLSSAKDELVVRMTKNPKLLSSLRDLCGIGATLVGFKLLSNVSPTELAEVARRAGADHAARGNAVYQYVLTEILPDAGLVALESFHALDVLLLFGPRAQAQAPERALAARMQRAWVDFAHGREPGSSDAIAWPRYRADARQALELNSARVGLIDDYRREYCAFWNRYAIL